MNTPVQFGSIDDNPEKRRHRNTTYQHVFYKNAAGDDWCVDGVCRCIALLFNNKFYIVPSAWCDENRCNDIGPYDNLETAAVAATLLEAT